MKEVLINEYGRNYTYVELECTNCGNPVLRKKWEPHYPVFCNSQCHAEFRKTPRIMVTCANPECNKEFEIREYKYNHSIRKVFFCCRDCKDHCQALKDHESRHINYTNDSIHTYRKRGLVNAEYCQICHFNLIPEILEVHHIDCDRDNNTDENLIAICPNCHVMIHKKFMSVIGGPIVINKKSEYCGVLKGVTLDQLQELKKSKSWTEIANSFNITLQTLYKYRKILEDK